MEVSLNIGAPHIRAGVVSDADTMEGRVIIPTQTHGCSVAVIEPAGALPALDDTDGIISLRPGLAVGVRTADCVALLLAAPAIGAVAAVHAGWKGSLGGIASVAVERLLQMGAQADLIFAAFGPSICGHCYEVSPDMAEDFVHAGFAEAVDGRLLDLPMVNRLRLLRAGVKPGNITMPPMCTLETPQLPSWRREPTRLRLLTWIEQ